MILPKLGFRAEIEEFFENFSGDYYPETGNVFLQPSGFESRLVIALQRRASGAPFGWAFGQIERPTRGNLG